MTSTETTLELVRSDGRGKLRWPTTVRLAHDGRALRIRFDCVDEHAWATHRQRDAPLWQEEVVELFLAPGTDDPKVYFELELNPLGALFDARVHSPDLHRRTMEVDTAWDWPGIEWRVEGPGERDDSEPDDSEPDDSEPDDGEPDDGEPRQNWSAELTLPFSGLGFGQAQPAPRLWRANFYRIERPGGPDSSVDDGDRHDEYGAWSPTFADPPDFHCPRHFGLLILDGGKRDDGEPDDPETQATIDAMHQRNLPVFRIARLPLPLAGEGGG